MSATNRGAVRDPLDYYGTPEWATRAIVKRLKARGLNPVNPKVLEPAAGTGAIINVLHQELKSPTTFGIEIDRERCNRLWEGPATGTTCADFLGLNPISIGGRWDLIITNPPFGLAYEFIIRSLARADCVVMLLRLNWLRPTKNRPAMFHRLHPAHIHVLDRRPSFGLNKHGKPGTDATEYAWFQWGGPGYVGGTWEILPT